MKAVLSNKYIQSQYIGLDMYRVRKRILQDFPGFNEENISIHYVDSPYPHFTILKSNYIKEKGLIEFEVSSGNPIRHLTSNYQNNEFLRGFLMIFQHIMNDTALVLDNLHEYFRPMESPASFLPVLADWLGIHLDTLGGEEEVRRFLQYAIPLYRYRGTALGLRAHLFIIAGVIPVIIEDTTPYSSMLINENATVDINIFDSEVATNSFTIHFPVPRSQFSDTLIRRLSLVVQREKPVHTNAYISFEEMKKKRRRITSLDTDTYMGIDGGISI
jgi:phage tail-like protein